MSLSVQRSVVESFNFNGKNMRPVYVKDVGQSLVSKDVYEAIGYEKEDGAKAIQRLIPEKYKIRFGDAQVDLGGVDNSVHTLPNTLLMKEPRLYCFLLRCRKDETEPFMEWIFETVLPREVRKLASAVEEKDAAIALLNDDLGNVIIKTWHCRHKRMCIRLSYKDVKISSPILKHVMFLVRKILVKTTSSSLYGKIQRLPMISFMTYHIMLQGYNDAKGMLS